MIRCSWLIATVAVLVSPRMAGGAGNPAQGEAVYKSNCLACHGASGTGDGPVAAALTPPPVNFASEASKQKSEQELLAAIQDGVPNTSMPSYKSSLSGPQLQDVLAYVLTLRTAQAATVSASNATAPRSATQSASARPQVAATGNAVRGATPADGASTYANSCVFCHDHNVGPTLRGRQLHPAYVQYVVRNGLAAMPAFRVAELDDAALAAVADYVAKLPGGTP